MHERVTTVEVLLIRHGESANNLLYRETGGRSGRVPDPPLTANGVREALHLAEALADGQLDEHLFGPGPAEVRCSLMARAIQTAAPVAAALGVTLVADLDLHEVGGPYEIVDGRRVAHPGSPAAALRALATGIELPASAHEQGWWSGPYEAEADARERARRVVATRACDPGGLTILVTHEHFTQLLLQELLGIPRMTGWFAIPNTSVTLVRDLEPVDGTAPTREATLIGQPVLPLP